MKHENINSNLFQGEDLTDGTNNIVFLEVIEWFDESGQEMSTGSREGSGD